MDYTWMLSMSETVVTMVQSKTFLIYTQSIPVSTRCGLGNATGSAGSIDEASRSFLKALAGSPFALPGYWRPGTTMADRLSACACCTSSRDPRIRASNQTRLFRRRSPGRRRKRGGREASDPWEAQKAAIRRTKAAEHS
jgi:hypothetical protein